VRVVETVRAPTILQASRSVLVSGAER